MIIPQSVQKALASRSLYTGAIDGHMGPLSLRALMAVAAGRKSLLEVDWDLATALWQACLDAGIDNRLRILHCIAQCCVETAYWRHMTEQGSSGYFSQYDGRYGNKAGEGYLYRGRGFVMLTFRANYFAAGEALSLDLINHPNQAAEPKVAAEILAWFWSSRKVSTYADANDLAGVTRRINGGTNGLADRTACLNRMAAVWPASSEPAAKAA